MASTVANFAATGNTSKETYLISRIICPNVPIGAEMLLNQYLTCCATCTCSFASQNQIFTGTCKDAGFSTSWTGSCCMDISVIITR